MTLLPPNASTLERAFEAAMAVPDLPVPLRAIWSAYDCPEPLLPWLAWTFSVDDWNASWPLAVRREVVARAILIQRRKGTLAAVRQAVSAFGATISIKEWWETDPVGVPGTFDMILALGQLEGAPPSSDFIDDVLRQVELARPLSRHFTFSVAQSAVGQIGVFGAARPAVYARLDMAA